LSKFSENFPEIRQYSHHSIASSATAVIHRGLLQNWAVWRPRSNQKIHHSLKSISQNGSRERGAKTVRNLVTAAPLCNVCRWLPDEVSFVAKDDDLDDGLRAVHAVGPA
jgi:hypothetical protein